MKAIATRCMAIMAMLVLVLAVFVSLPARANGPVGQQTTVVTTAQIFGNVKNSAGTGIDGITVQLYDIYNNNNTGTDVTKYGGGYAFRNLPPGYYHVRIASQDLNSKVYFGKKTDDNKSWNPRIVAGEVRWQNFTLSDQAINAHILGKVTDDETPAHPAIGATVTITDFAHSYKKTVTTSANGTYDMDFYAGTFQIDIMGATPMDKYSYSGPITLAADGEKQITTKYKPIAENNDNSKVQLKVYVNGIALTEWTDFEVNYTSGEIFFYDNANSKYYYKLNNRDKVTTQYHYMASERTIFSEALTNTWDGETQQLNFSYGHITPNPNASNPTVFHVYKGTSLPAPEWPANLNYTMDFTAGTLTLLPTTNLQIGDKVTTRYNTTEREIALESEITSGENKIDFKMGKNWIEGYAINETAEPVLSIITVTLYDKNKSMMLQSQTPGNTNYFTLSVPESMKSDEFMLVIHPDGYNTYTNMKFKISEAVGTILFKKAPKELFEYTVIVKDTRDWNNITIYSNYTWNAASSFPGIGNETLGNMRFQIDLNFGNHNGKVEANELAAFKAWLSKITPNYVSTQRFITLNDSAYNTSTTGFSLTVTDTAGANASIDSDKPILIHTKVLAKISGKKLISPKYAVKMTVDTDTMGRNSTYMLKLPKYYVRTSQNPSPDSLILDGYTAVTVDPKESSSPSMVVDMTVEKAVNATAIAKILTWNGADPRENETHAYGVPDTKANYTVASGFNITFSAESSIPGVGDIVEYKWDFGDKTSSDWIKNKTTVHKYKDPVDEKSASIVVQLWVKNSLGNITKTNKSADLNVTVDKANPTPSFQTTVQNATLGALKYAVKTQSTFSAGKTTIYTWVNKPIIFNASKSIDKIFNAAGKDGKIKNYYYDFGNKNNSGNLTNGFNYTYSGYNKAGVYNVTLNVTDVVGRYSTITGLVIVKTVPGFWMQDVLGKNLTAIRENTNYYFNATFTKRGFTPTTYNWVFENIEKKEKNPISNQTKVEYKFKYVGSYNVSLNVSDAYGNYAVNTTLVVVVPGPHPDLSVISINMSVDTPSEGQEVTITVNLTNSPAGVADNASKVVVKAYDDRNKNYKCDPDELIGTCKRFNGKPYSDEFYPQLAAKAYLKAEITWKPSGAYDHLIIINVTCANELNSTKFNNEANKTVTVKTAQWLIYAIAGGAILLMVIVVALVWAWKTGKFSGYSRRRKERLETELAKGREEKRKLEKEKKQEEEDEED